MNLSCFKCGVCDVPLFRQNPKGETGIWACKEHNGKPIDPLVEEITDIVQKNHPGARYQKNMWRDVDD